jgi:hypothetical protein
MVDFIRLLILRNLIKLSYLIAWIEGFAIFMGVFIVATVGSFNDWQKEKQFLRLQAESEKDNTVSNSITKLGKDSRHQFSVFSAFYP